MSKVKDGQGVCLVSCSLEQTIVINIYIYQYLFLTFAIGVPILGQTHGQCFSNSWFHTAHAKPRKIRALLCFTLSFVRSKTPWLIWLPWPWENFFLLELSQELTKLWVFCMVLVYADRELQKFWDRPISSNFQVLDELKLESLSQLHGI